MIAPLSELLLNGPRLVARSVRLPVGQATRQDKEEVFALPPPIPSFGPGEDGPSAPADFFSGGSLSGGGEPGNGWGPDRGFSGFWLACQHDGEDFLTSSISVGSGSTNHSLREWVLGSWKGAARLFPLGKRSTNGNRPSIEGTGTPLAPAGARIPEASALGRSGPGWERGRPLTLLWRGVTRAAQTVGSRMARPSGLGRRVVVLAQGLLSGASAKLRGAREILSASFGARPSPRPSADADPLGWSGEGYVALPETAPTFAGGLLPDEAGEPVDPVESLAAISHEC